MKIYTLKGYQGIWNKIIYVFLVISIRSCFTLLIPHGIALTAFSYHYMVLFKEWVSKYLMNEVIFVMHEHEL